MVKILRINMRTKTFKFENLKSDYSMLAGRALTGKIILDEVDPICAPLGAKNKIIFANGIFVGTAFPCPGRLSVGAKSPLTGGIKESNAGGKAATRMSQLGLRAIVIEEMPDEDELYVVVISKETVEFVKSPELKGKGNYETVTKLKEKWGEKIATVSIGPAGEQLLAAATVAVSDLYGNPARHAGRGGMGAVLGSKKVKALVLLRPEKPEQEPVKHPAEYNTLVKEYNKIIIPKKRGLTVYGTAAMVRVANEIGGLPTKNFSSGSFDQMEDISGEKLYEIITSRNGKPTEACSPGCVIRCSNRYVDKDGKYITSGFEYETIALNGSNLLIGDLDTLARIDRTCDDMGLDTIEMGNAMAIAMEAGLLEWGDGKAAIALLRGVAEGNITSRVIASGATIAGRVLGVARVPQVMGQGFPAYDPRVFKGMGAVYATSPMGADHTSGPAIPGRIGWDVDDPESYGDLKESQGKIKLGRELEIMVSLCDSFGFCYFVWPDLDFLIKAINAKYDWNFDFDRLIAYGKMILLNEHEFNSRAGIPQTCQLPALFYEEPLPPTNKKFDLQPEKLKQVIDYF
ncbi:MAG: aldehyde ferredoxin oxidoreductase [Candidatus Helarchaeota archaeon]|nr:aldehyde ferredoxin oxidoreductase [Candidatus Helarchaeota archaeon]